jgi:hypothetical protein
MKTIPSACKLGFPPLVWIILVSNLLCFGGFGAQLLVWNNSDANSSGSLRQAINDNNALGGGNTIVFSNSVTGTIYLTNAAGHLLISKDVNIAGPGGNVLQIDGNGSNRVFHAEANCTVTVSGLTLTNCHVRNPLVGGAVENLATMTLSNCTVAGCSAGLGGGVYNLNSGDLLVSGCTFVSNVASNYGSGIVNL